MKKLLLLAFVGLTILSCEKGENDPFMSLRSRDARITGEWELESMSATYIDKMDSNEFKTTLNLEDGIITQKEFFNGVEDPDETTTASFSRILEIMNKGKYKNVTTDDGQVLTIEGDWFWVQSDKNKSRLALDDDYGSFEIDRLTNSELVLKRVQKASLVEDGETEKSDTEEEFIFKKK
jgi:hypothetical protein